jgi:hypothetical protein
VLPRSPFAAAGPRSGDPRAAAGGGTSVIAFQVPQPPKIAAPVQTEPLPIPRPDPPVIDPKPQLATTAAQQNIDVVAAVGQGAGNRTGQGMEGGTGRGDGGNAAEGRFRLVPPSPRGLILPPSDRPGRVRGKEVDVWVFVDDRGQVISDSTRIDPSTGDRKFDERLKQQAAEWVFEPARKGGRAVAEWFRYTIVL